MNALGSRSPPRPGRSSSGSRAAPTRLHSVMNGPQILGPGQFDLILHGGLDSDSDQEALDEEDLARGLEMATAAYLMDETTPRHCPMEFILPADAGEPSPLPLAQIMQAQHAMCRKVLEQDRRIRMIVTGVSPGSAGSGLPRERERVGHTTSNSTWAAEGLPPLLFQEAVAAARAAAGWAQGPEAAPLSEKPCTPGLFCAARPSPVGTPLQPACAVSVPLLPSRLVLEGSDDAAGPRRGAALRPHGSEPRQCGASGPPNSCETTPPPMQPAAWSRGPDPFFDSHSTEDMEEDLAESSCHSPGAADAPERWAVPVPARSGSGRWRAAAEERVQSQAAGSPRLPRERTPSLLGVPSKKAIV